MIGLHTTIGTHAASHERLERETTHLQKETTQDLSTPTNYDGIRHRGTSTTSSTTGVGVLTTTTAVELPQQDTRQEPTIATEQAPTTQVRPTFTNSTDTSTQGNTHITNCEQPPAVTNVDHRHDNSTANER